jgi:sigma-B regulation protein RsbU (phosphoserine phosphatase)
VPLGSFFGTTYDEVSVPIAADDVFVFCSDGVSEAMNVRGEEFTSQRLVETVAQLRHLPAADIVHGINNAVAEHRAGFPPNDDTTIVALKFADKPS